MWAGIAQSEEHKNRWEDDLKSDITRMKITNWKDCIRNQTKGKEFVEKALQLL
jgi:hypothetical protein